MLKYPAIAMVWLYQKTLSPDHGVVRLFFPHGYCRFHPTCSNYMKEALRRYGFLGGGLRGLGRIFRCHPFSKGGFDPVS